MDISIFLKNFVKWVFKFIGTSIYGDSFDKSRNKKQSATVIIISIFLGMAIIGSFYILTKKS